MSTYDDGEWHAATLGHFIGLLVDAGHDPAVVFRVVARSNSDEDGGFVQRVDALMLPNGAVAEFVTATGADVHKTLAALMDAGIVT